MTTETTRLCPVSGKPLPGGYYLHPTVATQIRKNARRIPGLYDDALRRIGGASKISDGMPGGNKTTDHLLWSLLPDLQLIEEDTVTAALLAGMPACSPSIKDAAIWLHHNADQATRCLEANRVYYLIKSVVRRLVTTVDRQAGRRLVVCQECLSKAYVPIGRLQVQCLECGAQIDVEDSNADLREQGLYKYLRKDLALDYVEMVTGTRITKRQLKHLRDKGLVTFIGQPRHAHYQPIQIINALKQTQTRKTKRG